MTSANVSQMIPTNQVNGTPSVNGTKTKETSDNFMDFMSNATFNIPNNDIKSQPMTTSNNNQSSYDSYKTTNDKIQTVDKNNNAKMDDTVKSKLNQFSDDVANELEETTGLSKEQIEDAMSQLGLTYLDLMNPTNLASLMTKLTGSDDNLSLLMNEDFKQLMQNVEDLTQNLLKDLGIDMEQLTQMVTDQMSEVQPVDDKSFEETQSGILEIQKETNDAQNVQNPVVEDDVLTAQKPDTSLEDVTSTKDTQNAEETVLENGKQNVEVTTSNQQSSENEESLTEQSNQSLGAKMDESADNESVPTEHLYQMVSDKIGNQDLSIQGQQPATPVPTTIDVADVINQITEFTKVTFQQNATTMEMQLNPENLGKLYIQVSSKEGVITASIAAQNENVKEALENQVAMLKESMNQQGIKVEAVEVTIASHEFERNLEQNQQNPGEEQQKEQASKSENNRSINLLDEATNEMSEEDILNEKIMRQNGNSVNFTA